MHTHSSISIKLSALDPRYALLHRERTLGQLLPRALELWRLAAERGIALTIDAEEQDRLELSLQIVEAFRLSFVPGEAVTCTLGGCSKAVRILRRLAPISADELSQSASEARRWLQPPRSVDPFGTTRRRGPVQPSARLLIAEHVR